ncbi:MAG: hypothetical protein AAFU55_15950 [Pseudomonadota bacterium]
MPQDDDVSAALEALGAPALLCVQKIIEEEAVEVAPEHALAASLKWGQPSFALSPKQGTPVRLGLQGERPVVFVHCGTTLVENWRHRQGDAADTAGNRCVFVDPEDVEAIRPFIRMALTYRRA